MKSFWKVLSSLIYGRLGGWMKLPIKKGGSCISAYVFIGLRRPEGQPFNLHNLSTEFISVAFSGMSPALRSGIFYPFCFRYLQADDFFLYLYQSFVRTPRSVETFLAKPLLLIFASLFVSACDKGTCVGVCARTIRTVEPARLSACGVCPTSGGQLLFGLYR